MNRFWHLVIPILAILWSMIIILTTQGCARPKIYVVRMQVGDVVSNEFFEIKEKDETKN